MYAEIPLTKGQIAIVDENMADYLNQWKWYTVEAKRTKKGEVRFFAVRTGSIYMHRIVMMINHRLIINENIGVTHKDGIGTNNWVDNLKCITVAQRGYARKPKYRFKGVYPDRYGFRVIIRNPETGKSKHYGSFKTEIEAARAYNKIALELHGEFAYLNEIEET